MQGTMIEYISVGYVNGNHVLFKDPCS
jgi:hypothetical protein